MEHTEPSHKLELNCLYNTVRFTTFWDNQIGNGESHTVRHEKFLVLEKVNRPNRPKNILLYKVLIGSKIMFLSIAAELVDIYLTKID